MGIQPLLPAYSGNEQMMDIKDVAAHMRVSEETVRRMVSDEGLPCKKLGYRTMRFYLHEVTEWIQKRHEAMSVPPSTCPPSCAGDAPQGAPSHNSPPESRDGAPTGGEAA